MTERICLVCTGSRAHTDERLIRSVLELFPKGTIVYHGACTVAGQPAGADAIVDRVARELGHEVRAVPVMTDIDGPWPGAGPRRSLRMVKKALKVVEAGGASRILALAFPKEGAGNRGTKGCRDICYSHGITTLICERKAED